MTSTKPAFNEITPSQMQRPNSIRLLKPHVPRANCGFHVNRLVKGISSSTVKDVVGTVFEDLLCLLECLKLSGSHLPKVEGALKTFDLLQIIHDEARALVKFISHAVLTCEEMPEEVAETLDGITFAIDHDLHRVFDNQQLNSAATTHVIVAHLFRAHDLLINCVQQSTISLAVTFDATLDGAKLFDNSDIRYRQSIQLCKDISNLLELVEACGERRAGSPFATITASVEVFRNESLEFLMYSDWPQFESFCEKISLPKISRLELESVLHQFRCYLETLLGQVRMRAVLANVLPAQFGANNGNLTQDEPLAWDPFAVAV